MFRLFFFLLLAPGAYAAPLTLHDAASYAMRHSPSLDSSQRQALIAEDERLNARSAFLPTVDFSSAHGLQRTYPKANVHEPWASNFALTFSETLYDNGESITRHRIATLQEEIAREILRRDRDRLLFDIAASFFQYSLARKSLEIQQEQHAVLKLQVELVKESYRHGVKARKDYLRFQTQLNRSDIDLLGARTNLQRAELSLRRLLGVPLSSTETLEFLVDESRPPTIRPADTKLDSHRDYRIAQLQRRVSDLTSELARRKLWPELGLKATANYGSSDYLFTGVPPHESDRITWNALVTLNYNILDWGVRRRNVEIAASRAAIRSNELESELLLLREEVEKLQVDIRKQQEGFSLSDELLKLERANLQLITNEYREGKVQYLDYINSLQNFANAKSTYYTSLYDLKRGILARRYHEGTLYDALQGK